MNIFDVVTFQLLRQFGFRKLREVLEALWRQICSSFYLFGMFGF